MALPCTVPPCTEASDVVPGLYQGLQLATPSHHRELQTQVSTSAGLFSALANTAVGRIVLASGTYNLAAELSITRSLILEAAVAGSVILNAQASSSSPRRVLNINCYFCDVQVIGLTITGGNVAGNSLSNSNVRAHVHKTIAPMGDSCLARCLQGGGVLVTGGGTVSIVNSQIYSNTAYSGSGVYILLTSTGTVTITSSSIYGNTATSVHAHAQNFPSPPKFPIAPMGKG